MRIIKYLLLSFALTSLAGCAIGLADMAPNTPAIRTSIQI